MYKIGIEAVSFYIPQLYLSIKEFAIARGIEPEKLEIGLGLSKMALNDVNEDTATLAANALLRLIEDFNINPKEISKITLGTESALDGSKPTAMYAAKMVEDVLESKYGERVFGRTDITDTTFACVGGIDAMYNSLDYVASNPDKKAVVIAADYAKYKLASSGEYTQGSGAVALLISSNPKLISFDKNVGVATDSVFDFFKPKQEIVINDYLKKQLNTENEKIDILQEEPIFEGQYSNECYKNRIREAYYHLKEQKQTANKLYEDWRHIIFHLPYANQGQRIFMDIFGRENLQWLSKLLNKEEMSSLNANDLKVISASQEYKSLVKEKIESSQKPSAGEILYQGKDLTKLNHSEMRSMRKNIQIIFQDPYSSLNPKSTVASILTEPMLVHNIYTSKKERLKRATEILLKVGLTENDLYKYPHEFSGGQRQRIGISRSLVLNPQFIICDESVSALDISIQAQILNLLNDLKEEFGFTYIFISHDLNVVKYMSDNLLVLNKGKIEEMGDAQEIYKNPTKEYTKRLIEAIPKSFN